MSYFRALSFIDHICLNIDQSLRTLTGNPAALGTPYPANSIQEGDFKENERKTIAGLMRVNHAGEVCAQALYYGQAFVAKDEMTSQHLLTAAKEEGDHLFWCQMRLDELNSHTSYLNPFWYVGSFLIGIMAGLAGNALSLGFVVETEKQVIRHLETHLNTLPAHDKRTRAILTKMEEDEEKHKISAEQAGAAALPAPVQYLMAATSKIMVKLAFWL